MSPARDIVLLLGAGFSVDAGLPTMAGFGEESRLDFAGLKEHMRRDDKFAAAKLTQAGEDFYGFQASCRQSLGTNAGSVENLETLMCIAEALKDGGHLNIQLGDELRSVDTLHEALRVWTWKIYQQYPPLNPARRQQTRPETYSRFFSTLVAANALDRTTAISTNYDLVLEYAALLNGTQCAYPFDELEGEVVRVGVGSGRRDFVELRGPTRLAPLLLCKLHGSVNYFIDEADGDWAHLLVATDISDGEMVGKSKVPCDRPAIFALDSIWQLCDSADGPGADVRPAILAPSYAKAINRLWLQTIWRNAFEALRSARVIIVVGYSLPLTDTIIRSLIQAAIVMRTRDEKQNVFVIDPAQGVHDTYRALFGSDYHDIGLHMLNSALRRGILAEILENARP